MAWLGRRGPRPTPAEVEDQERSRAQIEAGGLPVAAERRLRELVGAPDSLFTSDLSVNEFALLHRHGIEPLTQVMGSSIFQHGWQNLPYASPYGGGYGGGYGGRYGGWGVGSVQELPSLSDAFNGARRRALDRLQSEAELAGADAVVGVRINRRGHDFAGADTVEFTAVGTAVRVAPELRTRGVVITDLSGQDYVQLAADGYRPVGVVAITTVAYIASGADQNWVLSSGNSMFSMAGRANQELPDFTRGFYDAREMAIGHLITQAQSMGAHGIVGVTLDQHIAEREYEDRADNRHHDLIVYIHLLGTGITEGHARVRRPALTTVLPLRPPGA
jgi:uncharacterized protein YbjQ (UPF0145 family)